MMTFDVDDLDTVVQRALEMGGHLDGPIQYPVHGKIAALRSPDGHMVGLFEPSVDEK
jgi:predicted enzyme related to lactoylglutathione lyase